MDTKVLHTIKSLIHSQFQAFQAAPSLEESCRLIGAATLAQAVSIHHSDPALSEYVAWVSEQVEQWEQALV